DLHPAQIAGDEAAQEAARAGAADSIFEERRDVYQRRGVADDEVLSIGGELIGARHDVPRPAPPLVALHERGCSGVEGGGLEGEEGGGGVGGGGRGGEGKWGKEGEGREGGGGAALWWNIRGEEKDRAMPSFDRIRFETPAVLAIAAACSSQGGTGSQGGQ